MDDLLLREDYHFDPLDEEIRLNQTFTAIAGERRESVFETDDMPDIDALDAGTGFESVNVPDKKPVNSHHRTAMFSLGDRAQSSDYILGKLRAAGFDVKAQARMMGYFYERGHF